MCTSISVISTPGNRCCTLAFRLHTPSSIFVILKFKHAHLKFSVYGRKQTDMHTYIHTHVRNAVTLVWGSLRLAPTRHTHTVCMSEYAIVLNHYHHSTKLSSDKYHLFVATGSVTGAAYS